MQVRLNIKRTRLYNKAKHISLNVFIITNNAKKYIECT